MLVTVWVLAQVLLNLLFVAGFVAVWMRLQRPAPEDPRMRRGLQLLQSKIAILEDLSDRTDTQVKQLSAILESRCLDVQNKIFEAEKIIKAIETSRQKSVEVARMFEDRIPHEEIVQRQNTVKYVKAARLANQGASVSEIMNQVNLSEAEVEFISKVNKDQLMFSEEGLPDWVQDRMGDDQPAPSRAGDHLVDDYLMPTTAMANFAAASAVPAAQTLPQTYQMNQQSFVEIDLGLESATKSTPSEAPILATTSDGKKVEVKPFNFKRI